MDGRTMPHYVYVLQCCEFVKIGYTRDPAERLKTLRVGLPFQYEYLYLRKFSNWWVAKRAEAAAQRKASKICASHVRREWFIGSQKAIDAVESVEVRDLDLPEYALQYTTELPLQERYA